VQDDDDEYGELLSFLNGSAKLGNPRKQQNLFIKYLPLEKNRKYPNSSIGHFKNSSYYCIGFS